MDRESLFVKKVKFELGCLAANTKLGSQQIHTIHVEAIRNIELLDWTQKIFLGILNAVAEKLILTILQSNNEWIRTKTLMKNAIVIIDATSFRVILKYLCLSIGSPKREVCGSWLNLNIYGASESLSRKTASPMIFEPWFSRLGQKANAEAGTWEVLLRRWVYGGYPPLLSEKRHATGRWGQKDRLAPSTKKLTKGMEGCPGVDSWGSGQLTGRNRLGVCPVDWGLVGAMLVTYSNSSGRAGY